MIVLSQVSLIWDLSSACVPNVKFLPRIANQTSLFPFPFGFWMSTWFEYVCVILCYPSCFSLLLYLEPWCFCLLLTPIKPPHLLCFRIWFFFLEGIGKCSGQGVQDASPSSPGFGCLLLHADLKLHLNFQNPVGQTHGPASMSLREDLP